MTARQLIAEAKQARKRAHAACNCREDWCPESYRLFLLLREAHSRGIDMRRIFGDGK